MELAKESGKQTTWQGPPSVDGEMGAVPGEHSMLLTGGKQELDAPTETSAFELLYILQLERECVCGCIYIHILIGNAGVNSGSVGTRAIILHNCYFDC